MQETCCLKSLAICDAEMGMPLMKREPRGLVKTKGDQKIRMRNKVFYSIIPNFGQKSGMEIAVRRH